MYFKLLKLNERTITPLPSTLSPHTNVQTKPPDSWPRAKKNNPCSRFSLFRRLVTVS